MYCCHFDVHNSFPCNYAVSIFNSINDGLFSSLPQHLQTVTGKELLTYMRPECETFTLSMIYFSYWKSTNNVKLGQ